MALSARTVVAPIDLSEISLTALEAAADAVADGGQLIALYVLEKLPDTAPSVLLGAVSDEERAATVERRIRAALAERELYAEVVVLADDHPPAVAIADYAKARGADLVVIGSHGRTGLLRLALGSVAERVIRLVHCPVLVIKA